MIKKLLTLMALTLLFNSYAMADVFDHPATTKAVYDRLPIYAQVKSNFVQKKFPPGGDSALVSRGTFEYTQGKGVIFNTTFPIQSTTDYSTPQYKQVNDVIVAVASGKYAVVEQMFDMYLESNDACWTLGLKPKANTQLSQQLSNIVIEGKQLIDMITINTKTSGKTLIMFENDSIRDFRDDEKSTQPYYIMNPTQLKK